MKAILCSNQAEFDAINAKIVTYWNEFLCPPNGTTEKWADPMVNPITNEIWIVVEDKILDALSEDEKGRIVSGNGSFPACLGVDPGLGYRLGCDDGDQLAFSKMMTHLKNKAPANDTELTIIDMNGLPHTLTYAEYKTSMVQYGDYCLALFALSKAQL